MWLHCFSWRASANNGSCGAGWARYLDNRHVDKGQEHGEGFSQEEWGALGILEMTVNHTKRLIVKKRGGVGLVLPLRLPASPPVVPPRPALLRKKVEPTS